MTTTCRGSSADTSCGPSIERDVPGRYRPRLTGLASTTPAIASSTSASASTARAFPPACQRSTGPSPASASRASCERAIRAVARPPKARAASTVSRARPIVPPRRGRHRVDEKVLAVERRPHPLHVESTATEDFFETRPREVGAVLVVDVPERAVAEDPLRVKDLDQYGCMRMTRGPATKKPDECRHVCDMLERVSADESASRERGVGRVEPLGEKRHDRVAARCACGVDADAACTGQRAHRSQEGRVGPASDLHDLPPSELVTVDPLPCECIGERAARGGACLGLHTARRVLDELIIVICVRNT